MVGRRAGENRCDIMKHLSEGVCQSVTPRAEPGLEKRLVRLVEGVARATKNIANFVSDEFFYLRASGSEIFSGIKFFW